MKNILLVEDDLFLIDIYSTKLKMAGFSVDVATDGETAIKKLNEETPDLLVLDIVLPKVDGWEILEKIQSQKSEIKKLEELKIIVLSNLGQKEEVEKGLKLGATKYLIKAHYTPSDVVEEIKEIFK